MHTAMILAAGRGERLKPLTNRCPKCLCPVGGTALIVHHIKNLAQSGYTRVIINHAWLGGKIRQQLGNGHAFGVDILYSPEPPGGLETAGGIVQALPLLGKDPFVCVNADIFTDYDYRMLTIKESLAHLVLVPNPTHNPQGDFELTNTEVIRKQPAQYTFSGIAIYDPRLFAKHTIGRYSLTPILDTHIQTQDVSGEIYTGLWLDIGSPERLDEANVLYSTPSTP